MSGEIRFRFSKEQWVHLEDLLQPFEDRDPSHVYFFLKDLERSMDFFQRINERVSRKLYRKDLEKKIETLKAASQIFYEVWSTEKYAPMTGRLHDIQEAKAGAQYAMEARDGLEDLIALFEESLASSRKGGVPLTTVFIIMVGRRYFECFQEMPKDYENGIFTQLMDFLFRIARVPRASFKTPVRLLRKILSQNP